MQKAFLIVTLLLLIACNTPEAMSTPTATQKQQISATDAPPTGEFVVPKGERWGIYHLDIASQRLKLLFSSPAKLSSLRLNNAGDQFVFSQKVGGDANSQEEIFALTIDGLSMRRLTDNAFWDLYPAWSPDDAQIAFLSQRKASLGIFMMNADGSQPAAVYDSNSHEADIDWVGDHIAFTKDSRIWTMRSDGSEVRPLSDPPRAGEWGAANLPFGDYDPRINPDGTTVVFERLLADDSPHGNYDLFIIDLVTSQETRLTHSGYSQGLASWSHSGRQIVYIVAAIDQVGQYDMYLMNVDGTDNRNITPDYFSPKFLCHWAIFTNDDSAVYFIGEWWDESLSSGDHPTQQHPAQPTGHR